MSSCDECLNVIESVARTGADDLGRKQCSKGRKNPIQVEATMDSRDVTQAECRNRPYVSVRIVKHREALILNPAPIGIVVRNREQSVDASVAVWASQLCFCVSTRNRLRVLDLSVGRHGS
jgi:hypothetical protein